MNGITYWALSHYLYPLSFNFLIQFPTCKQSLAHSVTKSWWVLSRSWYQISFWNFFWILWKSRTPFLINGTILVKSRLYSIINHICFWYPLWDLCRGQYLMPEFTSLQLSWSITLGNNLIVLSLILLSYTGVLTFQKIKCKNNIWSLPLLTHPLFLKTIFFHYIWPLNFACESPGYAHEGTALQRRPKVAQQSLSG